MSTRPTIVRRTARCTAATLWVTRTAPTAGGRVALRIGTAVARRSSPSVLLWRVRWSVLPAERSADLGPPAVGRAHQASPGAVGQQPALAVDHDHAAAHRGARSRHERLELAAERGGQQVGGGGRQHVGLRARLRAHLVVDAPADARGERDLERHDGQQQDVGQGQQQPDAEAHDAACAGASSSGATSRKPTPRIVCR